MLGLEQWLEQCNLITVLVIDQYCIRPSAMYARARAMVRAMQSNNSASHRSVLY